MNRTRILWLALVASLAACDDGIAPDEEVRLSDFCDLPSADGEVEAATDIAQRTDPAGEPTPAPIDCSAEDLQAFLDAGGDPAQLEELGLDGALEVDWRVDTYPMPERRRCICCWGGCGW